MDYCITIHWTIMVFFVFFLPGCCACEHIRRVKAKDRQNYLLSPWLQSVQTLIEVVVEKQIQGLHTLFKTCL